MLSPCHLPTVMPLDTTSDIIQDATRRNEEHPEAKKSAYLSRFCDLRQRQETRVCGLWLRRSAGPCHWTCRQAVAVAPLDTTGSAIRCNTQQGRERKPL